MRRLAGLLLAGAMACAPLGVMAQEAPDTPTFRVLDEDRLFRESVLGQRVLADIREAEQALATENQALFEQLSAEERALTEARLTLPPEEFRARAEAFDASVEAIRAERAERSATLARQNEAAARAFFDAALPILVQVMAEAGVDILLKPDVMILGPEWVDITDLAITRLDAATQLSPP